MPPTQRTPLYFSGRVHSIRHDDASKAFYILRMALDAECLSASSPDTSSIITVRGDIPGVRVAVGVWFGFEGVWDEHAKYGHQIKITRAPVLKDGWNDDTCEKILVSQGIGSTLAARVRESFKGDLLAALADPARIATVPGVTTGVAEHIALKWKIARSQFLTLDFLGDLGLPQGKIRQVWATFGDSAQDVLSTDPWRLVEIEGVSFQDCDTVAERLHLDRSSSNPNRVRGAISFAARSSKGSGHLYLTSGELLGAIRPLDPLMSDKDIAAGVKALMEESKIKVDRSFPGTTAIYDPWSFKTESGSAEILRERLVTAAIPDDRASRYITAILGTETPGVTLREAGERYLAQVGTNLGIGLSVKQSEAVLNALTQSVSIITGLPGSGKTTSLRMALTLLQEAGVRPLVVAPTGIAAKRVASVTGADASTIHRALKAKGADADDGRETTYAGVVGTASADGATSDGEGEEWGYSASNPHPAEVVVIDESSMVDQALLYRILTCTRPDTRLVFVGDAAQLPSVGAGNVLRDLIDSGKFPTVALTEIFRQADTSPIVTAAHDIFHGRIPEAPMKSDFGLIPMADDDKILEAIVSLSTKLYAARANFQVLSPRHAGTLGVTNLNTRLREAINPAQHGLHEVTVGGEILREGDRVIVSKNDYKIGVFNGDVAKVNFIDKNAKEIELKIHGPPVLMVRIPLAKARSLLRLAYAVTVHRCQGLEYDVVVMPIVEGFAHQLQRNLFYTAITRAKKKVVLLGSHRAMERAIHNNREDARNTLFSHRLRA
jgi:exodeoxyribonuclease V alpha subunit